MEIEREILTPALQITLALAADLSRVWKMRPEHAPASVVNSRTRFALSNTSSGDPVTRLSVHSACGN